MASLLTAFTGELALSGLHVRGLAGKVVLDKMYVVDEVILSDSVVSELCGDVVSSDFSVSYWVVDSR